VLIHQEADIRDSMITDGCVIASGVRIEHSVLSPGVTVGPRAVIKDSVILTDSSIEAGARVERAILDKTVHVGRNARVGQMGRAAESPGITTVGKNARIPARMIVPRGAVVDSDSTPEYFEAEEEEKEKTGKPRGSG
jgi:glucose-1-phosphate adenylyltransferase